MQLAVFKMLDLIAACTKRSGRRLFSGRISLVKRTKEKPSKLESFVQGSNRGQGCHFCSAKSSCMRCERLEAN